MALRFKYSKRQEIPADVAVAKLVGGLLENLVGFPTITVDHPRVVISQQILGLVSTPAWQEPKNLGIFRRGNPEPHAVFTATAKAGLVGMQLWGLLHLVMNDLRRRNHGATDRLAAGLHRPQGDPDAKEILGKGPSLAARQAIPATEQADPGLELRAKSALRHALGHLATAGLAALRTGLQPQPEFLHKGLVPWRFGHLSDKRIQPGFLIERLATVLTDGGILVNNLVHFFGRRQFPGLTGMPRLPTALSTTGIHGRLSLPAQIGTRRLRAVPGILLPLRLKLRDAGHCRLKLCPERPDFLEKLVHSSRLVGLGYKYQRAIHFF